MEREKTGPRGARPSIDAGDGGEAVQTAAAEPRLPDGGRGGRGSGSRANAATSARSASAAAIGNLVLSECPRLLIFVEGVGRGSPPHSCELCFWGENLLGLNRTGLALVRPDRLVLSPHAYGPGTDGRMWYFNRTAFPDFPSNMPAVWTRHFLAPARAAGATLVVGEWGGVYEGNDELWQDQFKSWLLDEGLSSIYWALNPNSGDTGT